MFKRANKITALLVAAASVMSVVPAMAADVTKISSEDGTVYNAVAYKDGKSYIDGEINGKDEATYYLADGKYTALDDIDSGSDVTNYGDKYADVQDEAYFVNLEDGTVTDDSVKDNAIDDAASALRKEAKSDTDGRYLKDGTANAVDTLKTDSNLIEIQGKLVDTWYSTTFGNKNDTNGFTTTNNLLNVYTDGKGNYIDADYNLGKIKVTTTASGSTSKSVTIDNTDATYDADGTSTYTGTEKLSASVVGGVTLGQDADYIYRKATVTVKAANGATITQIDGKVVASHTDTFTITTAGLGLGNSTVSFDVIQKISKAQATGEIDGAKYAKSVNTYIISKKDGTDKSGAFLANYTIADGKIVNYAVSGGQVDTQTITLTQEDGYYYTDFATADTDQDVEANASAVQTDVNGNLWRLNGGYIYKWNNDEDWDKVYKVDGSFNEMSVYDKSNIVAWNQDDEVYSVIGGKKAEDTTTPVTPVTPVVTAGWVQAANGTWTYNKVDGTKATGWFQDATGTWYYASAEGTMAANAWAQYGSTWYYLGGSGAMATNAWIQYGSDWYYVGGSGAMLTSTTVDGYKLGASGAWIR